MADGIGELDIFSQLKWDGVVEGCLIGGEAGIDGRAADLLRGSTATADEAWLALTVSVTLALSVDGAWRAIRAGLVDALYNKEEKESQKHGSVDHLYRIIMTQTINSEQSTSINKGILYNSLISLCTHNYCSLEK